MRDYNIIYNIYISRNLATQRENIYIILNYANKILTLYYIVEIYRNSIILDINKNFIIIKLYNFLRAEIFIIVKDSRINVIIINKV